MKSNKQRGGKGTILKSTTSIIPLYKSSSYNPKNATETHGLDVNNIFYEKEIIEMENDLPKQDIYEFNIDINDLKIDKSDDKYKKRYFDTYEVLTEEEYQEILTKLNLDLKNETIKSFIYEGCPTNNIYCKEVIRGGKKKLKGGDTVLQVASRNDDIRKLQEYCRLYGGNLKEDNRVINIIKELKDMKNEADIFEYINSHNYVYSKDKEEILYLYNNLRDIFHAIRNGGTPINKQYKIEVKRFKVDSSLASLNIASDPYYFTQNITYYDYNADIILGFQKDQFDINTAYSREMKAYIDAQYEYIRGLPVKDTRVLKDYTRLKSFTLYQEYCKDKTNFFTNFKSICLQNAETVPEYFTKKMSNSFASYIIEELGLEPYRAREILNKGYEENADSIYATISKDQWTRILDNYIKDLNRIILNAPAVTIPFVCYRGSTFDYITPNETEVGRKAKFNSTRSSSISFNYKASKEYYNKGTDPNRILYKILVSEGCKLLFVSPLAGNHIIHEMELIVPSIHSFISGGTDAWKVLDTSNNINNKNNICMDENDKIKSKKLILLPPEPQTYYF
jgi:hypothetical protein